AIAIASLMLLAPGAARAASPPTEGIPGAEQLLREKAWRHLQAREFAPAAGAYRELLAQHPGDAEALRNLATALEAAGDRAGARSALAQLRAAGGALTADLVHEA